MINVTNDIVSFASKINPGFGQISFYSLIVIYAFVVFVPLVYMFSKSKKLVPPDNSESKEYKNYLETLKKRLKKNKILSNLNVKVENEEDIKKAFNILDKHANELVIKSSSLVLITTAISQYGYADAFIVMLTQIKMIWKITHIYNQRPMISDILRLYANVAATMYAAGNLEQIIDDIDLAQYIPSIVASAPSGFLDKISLGTLSIITNSIIDGVINSLLVLRVGLITKNYFKYAGKLSRKKIRKLAFKESFTIFPTYANSLCKRLLIIFKNKIPKTSTNKAKDKINKYEEESIEKCEDNEKYFKSIIKKAKVKINKYEEETIAKFEDKVNISNTYTAMGYKINEVSDLVIKIIEGEKLIHQLLYGEDEIIIQAKRRENKIYNQLGLDITATIVLESLNNNLIVSIGGGRWIDKLNFKSMLLSRLLSIRALTTPFGIYLQTRLFKILDKEIESFLNE